MTDMGLRMSVELELQVASKAKTLPHPAQFREWVSVALNEKIKTAELTIRIVDEEEMTSLNFQYLNKKGPTNVLSFPYDPLPGMPTRLLGDIIICAPVIEEEAAQQNKELLAHWAHMIIHGILHLIGYDHVDPDEALEMEALETKLLTTLNFPEPYGDTKDT